MKLRISLTEKSIANAIKRLEKYRDELPKKTQKFIKALSEVGINAVKVRVGSISPFYKGDDLLVEKGTLRQEGDNWVCEIVMTGSQSVFVEFGAGVTFNTSVGGSKHPKGGELGYTIGSYNPSSPNASSPLGWWYYDSHGVKQHTYGTPTFAPLYGGTMEMITSITEVARGVFKFDG